MMMGTCFVAFFLCVLMPVCFLMLCFMAFSLLMMMMLMYLPYTFNIADNKIIYYAAGWVQDARYIVRVLAVLLAMLAIAVHAIKTAAGLDL